MTLFPHTDDLRIQALRPLLSPAILHEELPLEPRHQALVSESRKEIAAALRGEDKRMLVVVGPCSIHDIDAAREYAGRLAALRARLQEQLIVVMRVYFEKPRTTIGWKGLINDPDLNETYRINHGLRLARKLLRDCADLGVPAGTEFLETITPQFITDLVAWGAIGARTTESQVHRELASGLSMPVGFKNGTRGSLDIAADAIRAARHPHQFLGVTKQGISAIVGTRGNPDCHIILRGGKGRTNYDAETVAEAVALLTKGGIETGVMVDCSHGNSQKNHRNQSKVLTAVMEQLDPARKVVGVMLESHLEEGRQDLPTSGEVTLGSLKYGQSITDACMDWAQTENELGRLADAVGKARF